MTDEEKAVGVLQQIAGKRIRNVLRWGGLSRRFVLLVFTDWSSCLLKSDGKVDVIVSRFDKPEVASALAEAKRNGDEIEEFDFDADGSQREEMHQLLHALWSKAAAAADYDKQQWKRLADFLQEMGIE